MANSTLTLIVVSGLVLFWVAFEFLIARVSGWRALARVYPALSAFVGRRYRLCNVGFRRSTYYRSCVTFGTSPEGLFVALFLPFQIGHPPVFVPWSDIVITESKVFWFRRIRLSFKRVPGVWLSISQSLALKILQFFPSRWPSRNAA
jgi:hypothetical protein